MCDTPPGGACTLTDVWDFSSALGPWPVMISSPLRGGGLAGAVGSSNTCDLCRASWWGLTTCGFLGSGSKEGFGTGWVGSPNTLDCCRLCWLSLWWVALGSGGGASEVKTLDLFRAAWHWFTSLLEGSDWGLESLPNKLIEVLPPGGASTLKHIQNKSSSLKCIWQMRFFHMIKCLCCSHMKIRKIPSAYNSVKFPFWLVTISCKMGDWWGWGCDVNTVTLKSYHFFFFSFKDYIFLDDKRSRLQWPTY